MGSGCAFNLVSISLLMPTDMCKFSQFHKYVDPNWLHLDLHAIMKLPSPLRIRENVDRGILFPTVSRGDASEKINPTSSSVSYAQRNCLQSDTINVHFYWLVPRTAVFMYIYLITIMHIGILTPWLTTHKGRESTRNCTVNSTFQRPVLLLSKDMMDNLVFSRKC